MQRSIEGLKGLGDYDLASRLGEIHGELQKRHPSIQDFSLTGRLPASEVVLSPLPPETQRLVEQMKKDGYAVYDTAGKTPVSLKSEGMRYWYLNPKLENVTAAPALLAFKSNPSEFFLAGSLGIPFEEQLKLQKKEKARVKKAYPDTDVISRPSKISELTELALRHFKETGVRILGKDYGFSFTWADTYEDNNRGSYRAYAGRWSGAGGLVVVRLSRSEGVDAGLGLVSLVEIPRK